MEWADINWKDKMLLVPETKIGEPRHVPLSDYAMAWLEFLTRYKDTPWVFSLAPGRPLKEPRDTFEKGKNLAKLDWVKGLHDLRHFRATQWLIQGVDILAVKFYLGHKRIETTQRYLHFVPSHAEKSIRLAQLAEQEALEQSGSHSGAITLGQDTQRLM